LIVTGVQTCALPISLDKPETQERAGPFGTFGCLENKGEEKPGVSMLKGESGREAPKEEALEETIPSVGDPVEKVLKELEESPERSEERRVGKECRGR